MTPKHLFVIVMDSFRLPGYWDPRVGSRFAPFLSSLLKTGAGSLPLVASSSWTLPSHLSLLGGSDPWNAWGEPIAPSRRTISQGWRASGGTTKAWIANPMLLSEKGLLSGFDQINQGMGTALLRFASGILGLLDASMVPLEVPALADGQSANENATPHRPRLMRTAYQALSYVQTGFRQMTDGRHLVASLRKSVRATRMNEPSLVFMNFMETHEPYGDGWMDYRQIVERGFIPSSNYSYHSRIVSNYCSDTSHLHHAYTAAITKVDGLIRELFRVLERDGVLDDCAFVLLSDHGQCLGEHNFFGHARHLYDELVYVPCVFWSKAFREHRGNALPQGEFIDHRHVHRILSDFANQPLNPESFDRQIEDSLLRIGPAASFYRGRPFQHNAILHRGPEYWLLRMISREGSVRADSWDTRPIGDDLSIAGHPGDSLLSWAEKTTAAILRSPSAVSIESSVSDRIYGWGYT